MIKTKIIKRYIQTLPIVDYVVRTDHLAGSVQFELPNFLENIDFSQEGWQWFLYFKTTIDDPNVVPLTYTVSEDKNTIYILWEIDHFFTKRSGNVDIQLRGKLDTDKGLTEWNSSVATINLGRALDPGSPDPDENILEWYLDRMEQLAQSGVADILAERDRALAAEKEISDRLNAEIERSVNADNYHSQEIDYLKETTQQEFSQLRQDLTDEIYRSTQEDIRLNNDLNAEINRAQEAEASLRDDLNAEIERATTTEDKLREDLEAEIDRATTEEENIRNELHETAEELQNNIDSEQNRAEAAEAELRKDLEAETDRATKAEAQLQDNINAETERAEEAERQLREDLVSETERAEEAEKVLQDNIDAEQARAEEAERVLTETTNQLRTDLESETARAMGREAELDSKIDSEINRAQLAEENLRNSLASTQEELQTNIENETARAKAAETQLQANIDSVDDKLDEEIARSTEFDEQTSNRIDVLEEGLNSRIQQLVVNLNNEITRSEAKDRTHDNQINELLTNQEVIGNALDTEIRRSKAADETTTNEITSLTIKSIKNPTSTVSTRYYLELTRNGSASIRGALIDIPVTDAINGGEFDQSTGDLVLFLANGKEIRVPIGDLVQYYDAGNGLDIQKLSETNNAFVIKLDTVTGTQNILSVSSDGLGIDLSGYYTKTESNTLLNEKQRVLHEQNPDPDDPYLPSVQIDSSDTIFVNSNVLADLRLAYMIAQQNQANILQMSATTVNGQVITKEDPETGGLVRVSVVLYDGNLRDGNVLIASGSQGKYKDSGFTIKKSVPADAQFTDTLYYPTAEDVPWGLFSWTEKQKLAGIEAGAQVNVQADWKAEDGDAFIRNKPGNATQLSSGFMSGEDKKKLDEIEAGAQVNQMAYGVILIDGQEIPATVAVDRVNFISGNGIELSYSGKNITVAGKLASASNDGLMSAADKAKFDQMSSTTYANSFGEIKSGSMTLAADKGGDSFSLEGGNGIAVEISGKTVTISGKIASITQDGLISKENQAKLNQIEAGAEVNVQADWAQTNAEKDDFIKNKPVLAGDEGSQYDYGFMSDADKKKLDGIEAKAEVNQPAFSKVVAGDKTLSSDEKIDTLTLVPGAGIDISGSGKTVTIEGTPATPEKAGTMSAGDKAKLDGMENAFDKVSDGTNVAEASSPKDVITFAGGGGTTVTVDPATKKVTVESRQTDQADWKQTDTSHPAYIKNKPGLAGDETSGYDYGFMSNEDKARLDKLDAEYLPLSGGTMTGTINSRSVIPTANNAYDVGSDANRMRNLYAANAMYLGAPADGKGIFYNSQTGGFDFIC